MVGIGGLGNGRNLPLCFHAAPRSERCSNDAAPLSRSVGSQDRVVARVCRGGHIWPRLAVFRPRYLSCHCRGRRRGRCRGNHQIVPLFRARTALGSAVAALLDNGAPQPRAHPAICYSAPNICLSPPALYVSAERSAIGRVAREWTKSLVSPRSQVQPNAIPRRPLIWRSERMPMLNRVSRCTAVKSDSGGISGANCDERCGCQPKSSPTGIEIAPEPAGHGLPLSKCEAYNRVYEQPCGSS